MAWDADRYSLHCLYMLHSHRRKVKAKARTLSRASVKAFAAVDPVMQILFVLVTKPAIAGSLPLMSKLPGSGGTFLH